MTKTHKQSRLGELRVISTGKQVGDRNLSSLRSDQKDDIIGDGSHYKRTSVSCSVELSAGDRSFIEVIETHGPLDGEAIWNAYLDKAGMQMGLSVYSARLERLLNLGLIERIAPEVRLNDKNKSR